VLDYATQGGYLGSAGNQNIISLINPNVASGSNKSLKPAPCQTSPLQNCEPSETTSTFIPHFLQALLGSVKKVLPTTIKQAPVKISAKVTPIKACDKSAQPSKETTSLLSPSSTPTGTPNVTPSGNPSAIPSDNPSSIQSSNPSGNPSRNPSSKPSGNPSGNSSENPNGNPSGNPNGNLHGNPSDNSVRNPSGKPSGIPSGTPSSNPCGNPVPGEFQLRDGNGHDRLMTAELFMQRMKSIQMMTSGDNGFMNNEFIMQQMKQMQMMRREDNAFMNNEFFRQQIKPMQRRRDDYSGGNQLPTGTVSWSVQTNILTNNGVTVKATRKTYQMAD